MNPVEPDPAAGAPRAASPPDNAIEPLSSAAFAAHPPSAPADPEPTAPIEAPPEPHAPPWPASATLHYEVEAQSRGLSHQARASLRWRAEADLYELELSVRALWLQRSQTSQGQMGPRGLRPLAFVDRGRRERQLTMEWHENGHGRAVRSEDGAAFALPPLTQDRLSLFAHLGLQLLRTEVTSGQRWSVSVAGFNAASMWTFEAVQRETLPLPSGPTPAWRLQRLDSGDPELTLWYAPELAGPLPVRVRLREPNGTVIDQSVRDVKIEPRS
ncbi:hypothetical protein Talka_02264 [Tepidimonas alkaliphilus]|uniref:DUF3108 domain-containing protein n=2 Tax=Tepidimonas alkaliphilus TaxID=2588942 RepID=A0A554W3W7_9BURK|nr:hypothetical protein Talka_02264 [Tepidimonas alkaliphilus]